MELNFILGDVNSGKSGQLAREMVSKSLREPENRFFAIVPEQATLKMQKAVVTAHPRHASMNIDVVSFDRLARVVFSELGINNAEVLDDTGKVLVLRKVLDEIQNDLMVYQNKVRLQGFVEEIKSVVTELKQYDIDDNSLFLMEEKAKENGNRLFEAKLSDIRLIFDRFNREIENRYSTSEEILDIFARVISKSKRIKGAHIYLDGFTGFTPVQYKILREMMKEAASVNISFTLPEAAVLEQCPEYDLFCLSNETYFKLQKIAEQSGIQSHTAFVGGAERKNRKRRIFRGSTTDDEILFVTREILRLVRSEDYRFRDIAVITADMDTYYSKIRSLFREAGISCFIDYKAEITENPLARYVMAALNLETERFSYESVFTYLKTGLTELDKDRISKIENYCIQYGIKGIRSWSNAFTKGEVPEEIEETRKTIMENLGPFVEDLKKEKNAAGYSSALIKLFTRNNIEEKLASLASRLQTKGELELGKEYEQIYSLMMELLEKTSKLCSTESMTLKEYAAILEQGIKEIKIGIIPPGLDSLTVGDLTRTRLDKVKALFLIGANDGKIPPSGKGSGLLSQKERQFLKEGEFVLAPTKEESIYTQKFYLYLTLNKPSEYLYVTYADMAVSGEPLNPSYIIDDIEELTEATEGAEGMPVEEITEITSATWKSQALRDLAGKLRKDPDEALLLFFAEKDPEALKKIIEGAFFTNKMTPLDHQVALDLYGEVLYGSVSRYEKYCECPFKHFLQYGIRLKKRPEYEIAATDMGTLYHESIERYSNMIADKGLSFREVSDEESHEIIRQAVEKAVENMQSDILANSARNEFLVKRVEEVAKKTTDVLREQVKAGSFEPEEFEFPFTTELEGTVNFQGKIDRVDIFDHGDLYVKIIDYKSGNKKFSTTDIYSGLQLQLVAYMKQAIREMKKRYPEKNVKPGGVYYYLINDKFTGSEEDGDRRFVMQGLTSLDEGIIDAVDSTINSTPGNKSRIIQVGYKKDGDVTGGSCVAYNEEFENLMDFVDGKILEVSREIRTGNVAVEPYYENEQTNACVYCDYRGICKFRAGNFGTDWKIKDDMTKEQKENVIYGRTSV